MQTIHFFDTTEADIDHLRSLAAEYLPEAKLKFHDGPVSSQPDTTIISPFVLSTVSADIIAAMPKLKLIATRSTGFDHIDLAAAQARDIKVCNVPAYGENTVAEYAFGLLLALGRKIPLSIAQLKEGNADTDNLQGIDLMGKTLGILGAGRIGCRAAAIGNGFGMKVLAYDAFTDPARAEQFGFTYTSLETILTEADVLSLHVPNLPETKHLIDAQALAQMKPSAILINTARAEVVDVAALVTALKEKRIAGAALDVFEGDVAALQAMPNVLLTSHNAFNTAEAVARIRQTTIQNIAAFLEGHPQNQIHVK